MKVSLEVIVICISILDDVYKVNYYGRKIGASTLIQYNTNASNSLLIPHPLADCGTR